MVKSQTQILKRMRKRHPLFTLHGDPICFSGLGYNNCRIESGKKYDFRDSKAKLYLGNDPSGIEHPTHQVDGTLIYIVFVKPQTHNPNIGYIILTDRWN
jgi:hypothetical protein